MTHKKRLAHISKDLDRLKVGSPAQQSQYHHIEDVDLTRIERELHGSRAKKRKGGSLINVGFDPILVTDF